MKIDNYGMNEAIDGKAVKFIPQQQRLDWERQWLNENNSAFDVINNDRQDASSTRYDFNSSASDIFCSELSDQKKEAVLNNSSKYFSAEKVNKFGGQATAETRLTQTGGNIFGAEAVSNLASRRDIGTATATLNADIEELYKRPELKQVAVWRDGKKAAASMRLPENLQEDQEVVNTLRQWLADAGLKLVSLIVNGKVRWKL